MEFRPGTCKDCGAQYKLPASFPHSQAKCKACGGTVEIGEVQTATATAAAPMPAKKVAPAAKPASPRKEPAAASGAMEEVQPSGKKRSGPSMKEKLMAQRAAAEAGEKPAAAKPAAAKKAGASKASASKPASKAGGSKKASPTRSKAGARKGAGARGKKGEGEGGGARRRGKTAEKKKSPAPLIAGVVVVLLLVGGFFFKDSLFGSGGEANAGENVAQNEGNGEGGESTENGSNAENGSETDGGEGGGESSEGSGGDEGDSDASAGTSDEGEGGEDGGEDAPVDTTTQRGHPDSVDLSQLPEVARFADTTDEEWEDMNTWMNTAISDSSAAGNRAANRLKGMHRKALPVIMNHFKTLDFGTQEGVDTGDYIQRLLTEMCGGANYEWRYDLTDPHHYFRKRVVERWQALIVDRALVDDLQWAGMLKVDVSEIPDPMGGAPAGGTPGIGIPDLPDLDDIDD